MTNDSNEIPVNRCDGTVIGSVQRSASLGGSPRSVRPKWHYIYFLLAAFDLLTVSAGLYLTREIMAIYTRSVAVNQVWTERAAGYSQLGDLAAAVNSPGNDVFDTRDVAGESARMQVALAAFERRLAGLRSSLVLEATPEEAEPLLAQMAQISAAMTEMVDEANHIFAHFSDRRPDRAGKRMATMDRKFAALNARLGKLRAAVTDIQRHNFARQTAAAQQLQEYEYIIGVLIVLMVAGATLYGHKIARQMQSDAGERERHLAALSEAEARTRTILDTAADGIVAFDSDGRVETANAAAEHLFVRAAQEATADQPARLASRSLIGRRIQQLLTNPDVATGWLETRDAEVAMYMVTDCLRSDGTVFPAEIAVRMMSLDGIQRHVCSIRDITERQTAERALREEKDRLQAINERLEDAQNQLLQSEKMASIGQLAAGVAHEINNPLGYIGSNVTSLQNYIRDIFTVLIAYEQTVDPILNQHVERRAVIAHTKSEADLEFVREDLPKLLEETLDGVARVRKIVQDLKEFSHVGVTEAHLADLHHGLDSTLNVAWNELKYKARVVKEYGLLPPVECLSSQINQVFLNLLVNAAQAIEKQGVITIRSGGENGMVWVEIEDTGSGIAPQHMKRLFEPFFTTKPIGKGTGLGLSLCYSIVKKHRGTIEVRSELGKGTAFRVWLPIKKAGAIDEAARMTANCSLSSPNVES